MNKNSKFNPESSSGQNSKCEVQRTGDRKLKAKSKDSMLYALCSMRVLCSLLFALYSVLFALWGCATTSGVKESSQLREATVISGINIQDYTVTLAVNKPFVYTMYRSDDPYKIVVELPDVSIGTFNNRIVSERAGITEIVPSQVESPSLLARLEMLLQTPSMVEPEYKNNTLIIKVKREELTEQKPEVRSQKSEVLEEELPKEVKEEKAEIAETKKEIPELTLSEQIPLPKATEITDILFEKSADTVKVLIKGNGSMTPGIFPFDNRIVIDIPDVVMNVPLPSAVVSPLKDIRSGKYKDKIRLVFDLKEKTDFDIAAIGDSIVITLSPLIAQMAEEKEEKIEAAEITPTTEGKYTGKKISLDFQDTDIVPIFRLLADISGYNIVISPEVKGKLTMKLINVPWDQALDLTLKTFSLGKSVEGNIIRIAPLTVFTTEREDAAKAMEAGIKAEPLETKIFPISYANVSDVEKALKDSKILTLRGSISVDKRTSSMVVNDVPLVFPQIENLLITLDKPTPQVMIEARIVEVNTSDVTDLGIQWGFFLRSNNNLSSFRGLSGLGAGPFTGSNFLVDFPGGATASSGSGFTFGILNPAKTMGLDLQLSALQTMGKGKIISNPRIMTVDNGKAYISQGDSIPVRKLTSEGTVSTEFKDYTLSLTVTPHITPDNSISMAIESKKEEPDWTRVSSEGTPASKKREANTNVIIKDGETVVIGGVFKTSRQEGETGVPGLMNIPIIGWLFKNKKITDNTSEMLIFITPRIVHKP